MPSLSLFPTAVQGVEEFRDTRTGRLVRRVVDFNSAGELSTWLAAAPAFHARSVLSAPVPISRGPSHALHRSPEAPC